MKTKPVAFAGTKRQGVSKTFLTKTERGAKLLAEKRAREEQWRKNTSDPEYQALLKRAGTLSAVRAAEINHHGIEFRINPLDVRAASDLLDLLAQFGPAPTDG